VLSILVYDGAPSAPVLTFGVLSFMGTRAITPLPLRAGRVDSLPARGNSVKKRTRDMVLGMKRGSAKILWVHYNKSSHL
jgi:hypothetical protein